MDWRRSSALLWAAIAACSPLSGHVRDRASSVMRPTAIEISAITQGARVYPYATLTLLELMERASTERVGSLYLESMPTQELALLLLGSANDGGIEELMATLHWSPYGTTEYFVQVKWTSRPLTQQSTLFEFRTALVSRSVPMPPWHPPLEPAVTVVLTPEGVRFLDPTEPL